MEQKKKFTPKPISKPKPTPTPKLNPNWKELVPYKVERRGPEKEVERDDHVYDRNISTNKWRELLRDQGFKSPWGYYTAFKKRKIDEIEDEINSENELKPKKKRRLEETSNSVCNVNTKKFCPNIPRRKTK